MVWDEAIIETLFYLIYVFEIKVGGYVTFLHEQVYVYSILILLCVCRGLCKPPIIYSKKVLILPYFSIDECDDVRLRG